MTATLFNTTSHEKSSGFVYRWTYKPTGQYYIGIHKGHTNDGYTGSGARFTKKFNNTPREQWQREILFEGDYYTECSALEAELVNKETLKDPLCLNVALGGGGSFYGSQHEKKKDSYRTLPQQITLNGITYPTRMYAIKQLRITFSELDAMLIQVGWPCRYNEYNRY